jgi:hypothetical protein
MAIAPLPMRTILTISKLTPNNAASIVCPKRGIIASVAVHIMAVFGSHHTVLSHATGSIQTNDDMAYRLLARKTAVTSPSSHRQPHRLEFP